MSTSIPPVLRRVLGNGEVVVAATFLAVLVAAAVLAPLVTTHGPNTQDVLRPFQGPGSSHWLGTDDLGRDLFSRLVYGGRASLRVSLEAVALALLAALPVGLLSGFAGGWVDQIIMRVTDAGLSFPPLVLALAVGGVLGRSLDDTVLAIGLVLAPGFVRVIRGQAIAVREEAFVEASRAAGTHPIRIALTRLLPNIRSPLIVTASLSLGGALLAEASLSFIGLGAAPPTASWGAMLREAYDNAIFTHPFQLVVPGAAIAATVLAYNSLGDGLRDALGVARTPRARRVPRGLTRVRRTSGSIPAAVPTTSPAGRFHPPAPAVVEVRGLSVDFTVDGGQVPVVQDVSFTVGRGEAFGLVGESGSGKTVTALSLLRLLPAAATICGGQVLLGGSDLLGADLATMRSVRGGRVAMVFQDAMSSLNPAYTVGNQLAEAVRLHDSGTGSVQGRCVELLDLVAIPDGGRRLRQYPHELSGGLRQRVMIAMALAGRPELLVLDEPTTALDVTVQAQILQVLREVRAELDLSLLFVSHDLGVIAEICDRVAVMYAGQIVETATVDRLFARPQHPYTAGLLAAVDDLVRGTGDLQTIPGSVPVPGAMPTGCRFHPRCPFVVDACTTAAVAFDGDQRSGVRCRRHDVLHLAGVTT